MTSDLTAHHLQNAQNMQSSPSNIELDTPTNKYLAQELQAIKDERKALEIERKALEQIHKRLENSLNSSPSRH